MTFFEVSENWREAKRQVLKYSTMCYYVLTLRKHVLPVFGDKEEITEEEVQEFVTGKFACGFSRKRVKDILSILRMVARWGGRRKVFPYAGWEIELPPDREDKRPPVLSVKHQRVLMRHLLENPTGKNIGVLLSICTGMRIGEVCGLRWEDVDMANRTLTVRHTMSWIYNYEERRNSRVLSSPKTRSSFREIPIPGPLLQALRTVRRTSTGEFVVGTPGHSETPHTYRDYYERLLKRLGIPKIRFHGLRHTFATRCIESGCDVKTVSAILGHSNVATTLNLYVHPNIDQKKKAMAKMWRLVGVDDGD